MVLLFYDHNALIDFQLDFKILNKLCEQPFVL